MCPQTPPAELVLRRTLVPADRQALEDILEASRFFRPDEMAIALELIDDRLTHGEKSHYRFLVAEREKVVCGYCCFGPIPCTTHSYDIYWIAVAPKMQRQRIGRRLLTAAEEWIHAEGGQRIYVETSTRPLYESTRNFYLACAYRVEATLPDFYADNDGKVTLVKVLNAEP